MAHSIITQYVPILETDSEWARGFVIILCATCGLEYPAFHGASGVFGSSFDFCAWCGAFTGPDWPRGIDTALDLCYSIS